MNSFDTWDDSQPFGRDQCFCMYQYHCNCTHLYTICYLEQVYALNCVFSRRYNDKNIIPAHTHIYSQHHTESPSCLDLIEAQRSASGHFLIPPLF